MFKFSPFPKVKEFACDRCRGWFQQETAYSTSNNWEEFDKYYHYCFNCAKIIEKEENQSAKKDKRTLNKTGRVYQFGTRVKKEFLKKLKSISRKEKLKYVEVLEKALDYYAEKKRSRKNLSKLT